MTEATDILERARAGDPEAFQELVRPHLDSIRRFARAFCKNDNDADDLAQDALVKAFRSISAFDGRSTLSTWLYTIAKHQFIDYRRGKLFLWRSRETLFDDSEPVSQPDPERLVSDRECAQNLWAALHRIDEKFRTPLVLAEIDGLSYEEISKVEDVPIGTVRSRIARAKDQLKSLLRPRTLGVSDIATGTGADPVTSHPTTKDIQ